MTASTIEDLIAIACARATQRACSQVKDLTVCHICLLFNYLILDQLFPCNTILEIFVAFLVFLYFIGKPLFRFVIQQQP